MRVERMGRKELIILIDGCWALVIIRITKVPTAAIPIGAGANVSVRAEDVLV